MSVPGTRKARPAPSQPERAWAEMPTGRRRWATAPLTGTSSGQTRPPRFPGTTPEVSGLRTPILPLCPHPPAGAGGLVLCPPEPLGRTAMNIAAGTAVICATGHGRR